MNLVARAVETARGSRVLRNAGWTLTGELVGLVGQLTMFLMVTRTFPVETYGTFAAAVALVLFIGPFSSFGAGYLVVQRVVAHREPLGPAVVRAWSTVIAGAAAFGTVMVVFHNLVLPQAVPWLLVEVAAAELLFNQLIQANRFIGQAIDKLWLTAVMGTTSSVCRIGFAIWYLRIYGHPTIVGWGIFYALSLAIAAALGMTFIWFKAGDELRALFPKRRDLGEGLTFSINVSSAMLKSDADKWLLARMNERHDAGIYSAAYRILGLAVVPNTALGDATYARFFATSGAREALHLAKRMALFGLVLNAISGTVIFGGASLITKLLGNDYAESAQVLRWLAFVPMLGAWQLFAGNALSGIGYHRIRLLQTLSSAVLNIILNIILIPSMSWKGSALATIVTEIWLTVLHWRTLLSLARKDTQRQDRTLVNQT
jgi:O-antigen/teichoic acid export membrane protein